MSIIKFQANNFKSIPNIEINLKTVNCLIGRNNVGKSSIMKALHCFYINLTEDIIDETIFNKMNPYSQSVEICVIYDVTNLKEAKIQEENTFSELINKYIKHCSVENIIEVKFKREKNGKTHWNIPYEFRYFLKRRFPIFYLETRKINLYDWDELWEIIGVINPFRQKIERQDLSVAVFKDPVIHQKIQQVFTEHGIKIKVDNIYETIKSIMQLQMGGRNFDNQSNSFLLNSFGHNSFQFISLYVSLILRLCATKQLTMPTILIDEPELNLHPQYVERLAEKFLSDEAEKAKWFIGTHSPTIIKNIIIRDKDLQILHISRLTEEIMVIKQMKDFRSNKKIKFMSDREANLFFSEKCLFVEGETELELFTNYNLEKLFPKLQEFVVYNYDSKLDKLRLVHPKDSKFSMRYFLLLDMDKVLIHKKPDKFLYCKKENYLNVLINEPLTNKQKFYYTDKFCKTYLSKKRIDGILAKCHFKTDRLKISINDKLYRELINLIQNYFIQYSTYPVSTTIEGAIINSDNIDIFLDWFKTKVNDKDKLQELISIIGSKMQCVVFFRMLFEGKSDLLTIPKGFQIPVYGELPKIRETLMKKESRFFKKTSGWITEFLDWYFFNYIKSEKSTYSGQNIFKGHFREIANIIDVM